MRPPLTPSTQLAVLGARSIDCTIAHRLGVSVRGLKFLAKYVATGKWPGSGKARNLHVTLQRLVTLGFARADSTGVTITDAGRVLVYAARKRGW